MNAQKTKAKSAKTRRQKPETHLRVLSKNQRQQVNTITEDWMTFTDDVHLGMFSKL